jgi:tetratricopeptide (TPR) repeat protein
MHDNLGVVYLRKGSLTDAENHLKRAQEILSKTCGPTSPDLALNIGNLGSLYRTQGNNKEAESMYKQEIGILEKNSCSKNSPQLATALQNLASLYKSEGRSAEAEPLYKRAASILENAR